MKLLFNALIKVNRHVTSKNSRRIFVNKKTGKVFLGKPKFLQKEEKNIEKQLLQAAHSGKFNLPIKTYIRAEFTFGIKNFFTKKGQRRKNMPDISNLNEMIQDCLTRAKIIEDDRLIDCHDGSRRIPAKENFIKIRLFELPLEQQFLSSKNLSDHQAV